VEKGDRSTGKWLQFVGGLGSDQVHSFGRCGHIRKTVLIIELEEGKPMNAESRKPSHWPRWVLFAAFVLTVPVPYLMIVVGGLVPTFGILCLAVHGLVVAIPKFNTEAFWILGALWAHVVILGGILYIAAHGITAFLFRFLRPKPAVLVLFGLIAALLAASTWDIYRLPGHNSSPPANIMGIVRALAA
jgi:hypothetical protein